ncbi:MAG: hypothetical protein IE926_19045 [Micrococcales bacterium]|nr:hypothetical protein [Micrococcales bacterium]
MTDDTTRPLRTELGLDTADDNDPTDTTDTTVTSDATGPAAPQPETHSTAPGAGPTQPAAPSRPAEPLYRSGPAPFALLLGILGLVTAAAVLVSEVTDISIPWNDLGPWTVVGGGALVVLVGLIGLRGSRTQD